MSFMPNPGSVVRLTNGLVGVVTRVSPSGSDDRVWTGSAENQITADDIAEVIHEPELEQKP